VKKGIYFFSTSVSRTDKIDSKEAVSCRNKEKRREEKRREEKRRGEERTRELSQSFSLFDRIKQPPPPFFSAVDSFTLAQCLAHPAPFRARSLSRSA
jgi:hypothetical protein